jgi:hypothetical protein
MSESAAEYEPRYLAGIVCFNQQDFFEAHEVWESIWLECAGPERRFYQALIQAAVALYHFGNGNLRGAAKLYRTSKAYMDNYASPYLGLDTALFWQDMERCFTALLNEPDLTRRDLRPVEQLIPTITINPAPPCWPDPAEFINDDD